MDLVVQSDSYITIYAVTKTGDCYHVKVMAQCYYKKESVEHYPYKRQHKSK